MRGRQANGFVGRRAGKGEVLRYIELYDEFCLPQDRPKRNRKSRKCDEKQRIVIIYSNTGRSGESCECVLCIVGGAIARTGAYIKAVFGRLRGIVQRVIAAVVYRA